MGSSIMKIAFFTEAASSHPIGPIQRNHWNARVDISWQIALKSHHYNLMAELKTEYDLGIIIVPKNNPKLAFHGFEKNRKMCKQWSCMQEANQTFWQNGSIDDQINYLNFLFELDHIMVHNEIDEKYFKGLIPDKNVFVLQSLMVEDAIPPQAKKVPQNRSSCIIGGNMCEWYGGMDSFIVAQEFAEPIYVPSMGRKVENEEIIDGLNHLPYMNWSEWMATLNQFKYGVHLMRTYAAGTFALNAAFCKLPVIGWGNGCDTQRLLFPELSPDEGDMIEARKLAKHLKQNQLFYDHCSAVAKSNYDKFFSEQIFIEKFYSHIKKETT